MPSEARRVRKSLFPVVFVVIVAAGTLSLVLLVERLLHASPPSTDVIPPATVLVIRLTHPLTSRTAHLGDRFEARLEVVNGPVGIRSGLLVEGLCLAARKADSGRRAGYLRLVLSGLRDRRGHRLPLLTTTVSQFGDRLLGIDASLGAALKAASQDPGLYSTPDSGSSQEVVIPQEAS